MGELVVEDDIGAGEELGPANGEETRIAGATADEIDDSGHGAPGSGVLARCLEPWAGQGREIRGIFFVRHREQLFSALLDTARHHF